MKKRKRSQRGEMSRKFGGWLDSLTKRTNRASRAWTFERLEERNLFTSSPMTGLEGLQWYAVSNDTAQGQQLIEALELMWAQQSAPLSGGQGSSSSGGTTSDNRFVAHSISTDPYLQYQWHLFNVGQTVTPGQINDIRGVPGQDINVLPAWDLGYTGAGVFVAVVDDGVQLDHPDLVDNIAQQYAYSALLNRPGYSLGGTDNHGTAVAGLIAAGNNGIGGVGVAYDATIIPIKFLGAGSIDAYVNSIGANGAPVDIYNNSWGPNRALLGRSVYGPTMQEFIALANSARFGRNGLGAIHVFSSGNDAELAASAGSNGFVNSRYTIGVGMVDHDGRIANSDGTSTKYGNLAPSVLVVAPSASGPTDIINDFATGSGIFTTDRTGPTLGYNVPPVGDIELDIDLFPDDAYTSRFGGTSASAPLVSGVIALMLEANPNLTWRDVQEILVRSARQNDDLDESWVTNVSPLFRDPFAGGFGYGEVYPNDGDPWNDVPVYQIVPGMILEPAVQAEVGTLQFNPVENEFEFVAGLQAANTTFAITAVADGPWDGWVANNLELRFVTAYAEEPEAIAEIISGRLRVTVLGNGVTWGQIADAITPLDFEMVVTDPAALFDPTDERIRGIFANGLDATGISEEGGTESMIQLNPQYLGYHPIADPITNPEPLSLFTNGAGYTVSHGRGGVTEYGWAHGVVDAQLAVQLALQWHTKDQNLPNEKTYLALSSPQIRIRGAQTTNEDSGEYVIPGALSNATQGFAEYFNEFFKEPTIEAGEAADPEDPMSMATPDRIDPTSVPFGEEDPPANTRGSHIEFIVPAVDEVTGGSNVISVEWVEIQLTITGDANALDFLRITLVSPDGTHSELTQNQYRPENIQNNFQSMATGGLLSDPAGAITALDENGTAAGSLNWVYSTNRHWGERSDSKVVLDEYGDIVDFKNWELHFENYSGGDLTLNNATIVIHGAPIGSAAAPVERVMGKVGVDSGRFIVDQGAVVGANDKLFNFDRYITVPSVNSSAFNTPNIFNFSTTPFGLHEVRTADPTQERFAGNVTVYAIDNSTGQQIAQFVTGYDGNYYFDLPAGEYTIGIIDPLGRTALDNDTGYRNYDNEWVVTVDGDDIFERDSARFDVVTGKFHYLNDLNFLLDPGSVPAGEVVYTGEVVGDLNGNGAQDEKDTGVTNFRVYADLNHTGKFEPGEPSVFTDAYGHFELHVATGTPNTFSITVDPPAGWNPTSPASGVINDYSQPGETVSGLKFLVQPPSSPTNDGNGYIFGFVFDDKDSDGVQDTNESGKAGITVFIDANQNGALDEGELSTVTSSTGAYQFGNVTPGLVQVGAVIVDPLELISPAAGFFSFSLLAGEVVQNKNFGVHNLAVSDFGDLLGSGFQTNSASSIVKPGFSLGASVDAEARPRYLIFDPNVEPNDPNYPQFIVDPAVADAQADDQEVNLENFDDEDGVVLVGGVLRPGSNLFAITVNGVGGYLQGWIDFNNNGTFDSNEQVFTNLDINPGTHQLVVNAPTSLVAGEVAARFRWGTVNQTFFGTDSIGEIEDYLFETAVPAVGDYNADGTIDQADYTVWKKTFGSTIDLRADGNKNGVIDIGDYTVWRNVKDGGGGGGAAAIAMAPPLAEQSLTVLVVSEPIEAPAPQTGLQLLGEQPVLSGSAAGFAAQEPDSGGAGSGGVVATDRIATGVPLFSVFTASVTSADAQSTLPSVGISGESADLAMLLLATGYFQGHQLSSDDDADAADEAWLDDGQRDGDLDLAIAAAFEDERDWRYAL